jgi:hypothetical protein
MNRPWEDCTPDDLKKVTETEASAFFVSIRECPNGSSSAQVRYVKYDDLKAAEARAYATIGSAQTPGSAMSRSIQLIVIPSGKTDIYNRCVGGLNIVRDDWDTKVMAGICSFTKHRRKFRDVAAGNKNPFYDEKPSMREHSRPLDFAYSIITVLQDSVMVFFESTDVGIGILNCKPRRLPYILHEALRTEGVFCTPGVVTHPLAIPLLMLNGMLRYHSFERASTTAIQRVQREVGFYYYDTKSGQDVNQLGLDKVAQYTAEMVGASGDLYRAIGALRTIPSSLKQIREECLKVRKWCEEETGKYLAHGEIFEWANDIECKAERLVPQKEAWTAKANLTIQGLQNVVAQKNLEEMQKLTEELKVSKRHG